MSIESMFGDLALRISPQPENIATEALCYLLRRHKTVWTVMRSMLATITGTALPEKLVFKTQVSSPEDNAYPDLVGIDSQGAQRLIIEAKFWAPLQPSQPAVYLRRLAGREGGMVVVIAPAKRKNTIWAELESRCKEAGIDCQVQKEDTSDSRWARVDLQHTLALVSWRSILAPVLREAESRGESRLVSDAQQLQGLCERMDSEEFLPLTTMDVSQQLGRRIVQYGDLIDDVVMELAERHGANRKGLTTGGEQVAYGRYFLMGSMALFLVLEPRLWASHGVSPIWLRVKELKGKEWISTPNLRARLETNLGPHQDRLYEREGDDYVALLLPLGVERQEVISELIRQIKSVAGIAQSGITI